MRIALIRRGYSATGGAEAYLLRLASGLQNAGHKPVLITTGEWPRANWVNESIQSVNARSPSSFALEAGRLGAACDVVFSMERIGRCDIYRAGDGVHRAWQERRQKFEPGWKRCLRVVNRKNRELLHLEAATFAPDGAACVIANSDMVRREILNHFAYPGDQICVIRNGFDPPPANPAADKQTQCTKFEIKNGNRAVVLFAGSGWERKGLRFAVDAMRGMASATLVVAGRGRWSGAVPDNVQFLGPVADMPSLLRCADVFLAPTIYDPFSNACLEALAAGLPVVTTDANGFSEIIDDGRHGSVVKVGDVPGLKSRVEYWASARHDAAARERCRSRAAEYSLDRNVSDTLDVINRVAAR
jgi:UDP-glucose:(heptosyl)LPS alpha-1,3-glucosyltransferase